MKRLILGLCSIVLALTSLYAVTVVYDSSETRYNMVFGEYVRQDGNNIVCAGVTLYGANLDAIKVVEMDEPLPVDFAIGKYKLTDDLSNYVLITQ